MNRKIIITWSGETEHLQSGREGRILKLQREFSGADIGKYSGDQPLLNTRWEVHCKLSVFVWGTCHTACHTLILQHHPVTPEVLNLVCQDTSHQGDDDIAEADDHVCLGDLSPREAETEHVEVEEGIDDGETGGLEGQPELDIE